MRLAVLIFTTLILAIHGGTEARGGLADASFRWDSLTGFVVKGTELVFQGHERGEEMSFAVIPASREVLHECVRLAVQFVRVTKNGPIGRHFVVDANTRFDPERLQQYVAIGCQVR